jgi:hypothetical protein
MKGHASPRLKVKFDMGDQGLTIIRPDGVPFVTFQELALQTEQERARTDRFEAGLSTARRGRAAGTWELLDGSGRPAHRPRAVNARC